MREKLLISDQSFLFISSSSKWNTSSRKCLADSILMRDGLAKVIVICVKGTILEKELNVNGIPNIILSPKDSIWKKQFELIQIVRSKIVLDSINLIHCYDYDSLLPVGIFIKRNDKIPFIYTCNDSLILKYKAWLHDYFIKRLDLVLTFSDIMKEEVEEILPVAERRVFVIGMGVQESFKKIHKKSFTNIEFKIGMLLPADLEEMGNLTQVVRILETIRNDESTRKEIKFCLFTTISWTQHPLHKKLKSYILERGLEHEFLFLPKNDYAFFFQSIDALLSYSDMEQFSDYELSSLLLGIPLILPRTSSRVQLLDENRRGVSYKGGDSRELKDKLVWLIDHYASIEKNIKEDVVKLWDTHSEEQYNSDIAKQYEKLIVQRERYSLSKKRPANS